ncbi:hypothetical protein PUN28_017499 [Cardiocondyla obscurior]|uniref:Uncharacterized protein n=1 Tax=Cardiocondyla obscurior TaxID=286306 RepID=A0AAW2EHJ8_9HYME
MTVPLHVPASIVANTSDLSGYPNEHRQLLPLSAAWDFRFSRRRQFRYLRSTSAGSIVKALLRYTRHDQIIRKMDRSRSSGRPRNFGNFVRVLAT